MEAGLLLVRAEELDLKQVTAVTRILAQGRPVTVRSAGMRAATVLAEPLAQALRVDWMLDGNWDVLRTEANRRDFGVFSAQSLPSPMLKAVNLASNSSEESEDLYFQRLHLALRTHYIGFQVIITAQSTLQHALARINQRFSMQCVQMAALIGQNSTWRVAQVFESDADVVNFMLAVPLRESHNAFFAASNINFAPVLVPNEAEDKMVPLRPLELPRSEKIPEKITEEIRKMMENFGSSLRTMLNVQQFAEEERLKYLGILANLDKRMLELEQRLENATNQVQEEAQALEIARDSMRAELNELIGELQSASISQTHQKQRIATVSASLTPAFGQISHQLQDVEGALQAQQATLTQILNEQKVSKSIFVLGPVSTLQSTAISTKVVNTKRNYTVEGKIVVSGGEGEKQIAMDLSKGLEVELGSVATYTPGQYSVCVRGNEGALLSNVVTFQVDEQSLPRFENPPLASEAYLDSLLYKALGTIDDIEHQIAEKAPDGGLPVFRKLAATWKEADANRIQEFIDICLQTLADGEEATRVKLQSHGFKFHP